MLDEAYTFHDLTNQVLKGYQVQERIGAGGFGAVFRALQPVIQREVAIKVILPQYANQPYFIRRFETEAQLVARLEHPHIVPLYDYWREPTGAYLVMRYVRGGNLRATLDKQQLSIQTIVLLIEQVAAALAIAHRNGVIHRDIKPANILLDESGNAYLTDFGIAKVLGDESKTQEEFSGSPAYVSPEQIRSDDVTPQTDVYGLGIVLYELIARHHPFEGITPSEMIFKQLEDPLPDISAQRPDLPAAVNDVIQTATAKVYNQRYPDTVTFATALREALFGESSTPSLSEITITTQANPYKGLRAFEEADALDFFGREALVAQLVARLKEDAPLTRFLAVVGPSGSGKSSVVKAGLLPALRNGGVSGSDRWFFAEFMPGEDPLQNLAIALQSVSVKPSPHLLSQLQADPQGLVWAADRALADVEADLVLIVDQLEEVFTLTEDEGQRVQFLKLLTSAVTTPDSRVRVVITIRADFMDRPLQYVEFGELIRHRTEFVLPLSQQEIERVIIGPAQRAKLQVDTDLIAAIVADVRQEPGALPLLEYTLTELFERRQERHLTLAAYQNIGGLTGAVAKRAEEVFTSLRTEEQIAARQIFLRLVTLGEGTEDTRRRISQSELNSIIQDRELLENILSAFGRSRLLTFDRDPATRESTVEVAHEALLREWERLREWLDTSRADIRLQRLLANAAAEWDKEGNDKSFLLSGGRLAQYEEWAATTGIALAPQERAYLAASVEERKRLEALEQERQAREDELEQRSRSRLRYLAGVLVIFSIVTLALSLFAFDGQGRATAAAEDARVQAERAERSAAESHSLTLSIASQQARMAGQPDLALALALEANRVDNPPPEARRSMADSADFSWIRDRFLGHAGIVWVVRFLPDGQRALSGSGDTNLILWDVATGEPIRRLEGHTSDIYGMDVSPDGVYAVSGQADGDAILWDIDRGQVIRHLEGHTSDILGIDFAPDGKTVLTASADDTLILWSIPDGERLRQFEGHEADVWSVAFSPDGKRAISGSEDTTLILWDVETGGIIRRYTGHEDGIVNVAMSPDGKLALSGAWDNNVILWDVATGSIVRTLQGHTSLVWSVAFSPDGQTALSGGDDNTIILWDVATGEILHQSAGHLNGVFSIAYSPDGRMALSAADDQTPILWDLTSRTLRRRYRGHTFEVTNVAFSPDGQTAISGSHDSTAIIWNLNTGAIIKQLTGHASHVESVAFSPDGNMALTASADSTLRLWDVATGELIRTYEGHEGHVNSAAFSPDGKTLLSAGDDMLILWDLASGDIVSQLKGHTGPVRSVDFSPDGKLAVSGSDDNTALVWDVGTGSQMRSYAGHTAPVLSVAFSPDGQRIITGSRDTSMILWDMPSGSIMERFEGHTADVSSVAFSPDGQRVLSGSADNSVLLWSVASGEILRRFQGHSAPVFSVTFSPDGLSALSGSDDATMALWDIAAYPGGLIEWIQKNRYVPEFSCVQRVFYRIEPLCETATS
jgi:WD40 repeat protein/serine/threonine protein kinase